MGKGRIGESDRNAQERVAFGSRLTALRKVSPS